MQPPAAPTAEDVLRYLPLVRRIVATLIRRLPPNVLRDDLLAAGTYGLIDSLRKNGHVRGPAFEWYARVRIRGAIVDELRSQDWLSRRARGLATQVANEAGRSAGMAVVSFDELIENVQGFEDERATSPLAALEQHSDHDQLKSAVRELPDRERMIVELYYFKGVHFKAIAERLGVSEPRISQLHARAIGRLRARLADDLAEAA